MFFFFVLFMVAFMITGALLNAFLLEKYYIFKSKDTFSILVSEVKTILSQKDNIQQKLGEIDRINGVSISVADRDRTILFTSFPQKIDDNNRLPKEIGQLIESNDKNIKKKRYIQSLKKIMSRQS